VSARTGASPWRRLSAGALAVLSLVLVAASVGTVQPAQADITNGLLLRYKLDETWGNVAHDSSGNGRDGTVNGGVSWGGDQGLAFNGSDTYVKVPNNIMSGLNSITVDFDVWIDWNVGKPYFLYGFGNTNGTSGNGYLFSTGNQFRTAITTSDGSAEQQTRPGSSYLLAFGMWKHVTYTQTGNTGILYENGVEKARNTNVTIAPGAIGGGTTTANYIGKSLYSSDRYFWGRMRDFRVYNRALSSSEVNAVATGTEQQWEQLQALAAQNGALAAFDDPSGGPKIVFPADYSGDINNLQTPSGWTNEFGQTPTQWPNPVRTKSALFTSAQITEIQDAVSAKVQPSDGGTIYDLRVYYDGPRDRVVAQTNAPSSVTDPLVAQYAGKLVVESYTLDSPAPAKCTPDLVTAGKVLSQAPAPADGLGDAVTKLQWQQVQALADYNCALGAYNDPGSGPKIVFPADYAGDINDLRKPPGWTSDYGNVPAEWPAPAAVKSQLTLARVVEIEDAAKRLLGPDAGTPECSLSVQFDGARDRVVVTTDIPSWVTDQLTASYPNQVVVEPLPQITPADPGNSSAVNP
jgi:hypothetical protein